MSKLFDTKKLKFVIISAFALSVASYFVSYILLKPTCAGFDCIYLSTNSVLTGILSDFVIPISLSFGILATVVLCIKKVMVAVREKDNHGA